MGSRIIKSEARRKTLFKKGEQRPGTGRKKGQQNRITRDLKEAIIMAAEMVGSNGAGKDGCAGYLAWLAKKQPQVFGMLMGKLLPMQLTGANGGPLKIEHKTKDDLLAAFKQRGLPAPTTLMLDRPKEKVIEHKETEDAE